MIGPELEQDTKKYNALEPIFQKIMKSIALSDDTVRRNQVAISEILELIIRKMRDLDIMFSKMYQKIFYGGSFYDKAKLRKPDEFDLDLLLVLPKLTSPTLETSENGFIQVKLLKYSEFKRTQDFGNFYSKMDRFVDSNNYLLRSNFYYWFESLIIRAQNLINQEGSSPYNFVVRNSGPALTLMMRIGGDTVCVDLVPSFTFTAEKWPSNPFRKNPVTNKPDFFIVPKASKVSNNDRLWRLSFQEQERSLLHDKNRLRDSLKLLKLLRDEQGQERIASYFLKTVVLWMDDKVNTNFWSINSLSYTVMMALKYYNTLLDRQRIDYFWNQNNNLLAHENSITLRQWSQRIQRIIKDIERNLNSPRELERIVGGYFGLRSAELQGEFASAEIQTDSWCVIS